MVKITQGFIDRYAEISGDHNPIHVDPEFARRSPFGGTIAHGTIGATYLLELLNGWLGTTWPEGCTVGLTYTAPVPAGETIRVCGRVELEAEEGEQGRSSVELWCERTDGEIAIRGTAR